MTDILVPAHRRRPAGEALRAQRLVPGLQRLSRSASTRSRCPARSRRPPDAAGRRRGLPAVRPGSPGRAKRGRFGPFVGCDRYPDCKYIKKNAPPASERFGTCPQCGQGTVVTKRSAPRPRPFWGCDRYPDCDYSTWTRPAPRRSGARTEREARAAAADGAAGPVGRQQWPAPAGRVADRVAGLPTRRARWSASSATSQSRNVSPGTLASIGATRASSSPSWRARGVDWAAPGPGHRARLPRRSWPTATWRLHRLAGGWPRSARSTATPHGRAGSAAIRWPASARPAGRVACPACCSVNDAARLVEAPASVAPRTRRSIGEPSRRPWPAAMRRYSSCCMRPACASASSLA